MQEQLESGLEDSDRKLYSYKKRLSQSLADLTKQIQAAQAKDQELKEEKGRAAAFKAELTKLYAKLQADAQSHRAELSSVRKRALEDMVECVKHVDKVAKVQEDMKKVVTEKVALYTNAVAS